MTQATISIDFPSEERLKIVLDALRPETKISVTSRSKVHAEGEGTHLKLIFEATDTSALRAALNSYLHWIVVINDICSAMETTEKKGKAIRQKPSLTTNVLNLCKVKMLRISISRW